MFGAAASDATFFRRGTFTSRRKWPGNSWSVRAGWQVLLVRLASLGAIVAVMVWRWPAGVAVGDKGRVYVADAGNARVQVFDSIGNWIAEWKGPAEDPLVHPAAIDVDRDGSVWVADAGAGRVRLFTAEGFPLFSFRGDEGGRAPFGRLADVEAGPEGRVWVVDAERGTVDAFRVERGRAGER